MRNVVLVAGGREYDDFTTINKVLDELHKVVPITKIVQGYARGADKLADEWARKNNVRSTGDLYKVTSHEWRKIGRGAGVLRNRRMRDEERPDVVVCFPGGEGTANMLKLALDDRRIKSVYSVTETGQLKNESRGSSIDRLKKATR